MKFDCIRIVFMMFLGIIFHLSCKKETSGESCGDKNNPPIAVAGPDRTITLPTDSVLLDGSSSNDPDGRISNWLWTKISGPAPFNIIRSSDSITTVKTLVDGTYQFELKVTDNGGLSAKDTLQVIVDAVATTNHPPIANAGTDQATILPTSTINLDGSGSTDPDNNITTYAWTKISGPSSFAITNSNAVQTQANNLVQGTYQFELKVTDAGGLFSKDTMEVTLNANSTSGHPPIAVAGSDLTITIDVTVSCNSGTITLNGSGSIDPDGIIVSHFWSNTEGQSANIGNPNSVTTAVSNLSVGTYFFILLVKDNNGLEDDDTVSVTVNHGQPLTNVQLIPFGTLSQARCQIVAASAGNKILFAGGVAPPAFATSRVDIYDMGTQNWSSSELSMARQSISAIAAGNKIFFAGGTFYQNWSTHPTSRVDIYDVITNTWSTAELSISRGHVVTATAGNKVFFAGGDSPPFNVHDRVDIYDLSTNAWSLASLSEARTGLSANVAGNIIYFVGGHNYYTMTNKIDMYDNLTNTWSISFMSEPKTFFGNISVANKIYWAGGATAGQLGTDFVFSCQVEVRDLNTSNSEFTHLSRTRSVYSTVKKGDFILFLNGCNSEIDIYNYITNTWSIGVVSQLIGSDACFISINGEVYVAGGTITNQVWRLEF